jgi:hypothetical protein
MNLAGTKSRRGVSLPDIMGISAPPRIGIRWLRRLGRVLAVATQLVVLLAPIAEAHEERGLAAHVEVPGNTSHVGHNPERCPACILLGVHSRAAERTQIPTVERGERMLPPAAAQYGVVAIDAPANSSRAPPIRG